MGVAMLQLNRVPETRRLGSTEAVSLNHLAGIRTFIEGYGSNRMDQRGDARACLVPLAGLDAQAVAQELSRGLIHTGVAAREYPPRPCELWVCGFSPCRRRAVWFPEPVYSCGLRGCTG